MMKKWQSIIAAAVFSAFWAIPASAESYGCADGTSSCHTNSGSTGRVSNGGTSGSSGSPSSLGASSSGGATSPDPHLFGCGASPLCSGQSSASADQNVIIASNGPYAANYGTWRSEYIGTKTANGKYASPSINIYSNTKNSLRCTGKINLEDDNGFMLPAAITTKIVPANASGTLVSANFGVASWAPSFSVQCENINDYPPAGSGSSSGTTGTGTATSSNGSAAGAGSSNSIPGPSFQIGQGLVQPGISIVPGSNPASGSGNSAGSSAPNCLEPDGCYFGFFGKIATDSGPADGLVKKIRFSIEQVSDTTGLPSGDIRVEVWAMLDGKSGYLLGQKNLSSLESGYYRPTSVDADVTLMPSGSYRAMLVVRSAIGSDALQMDGLLVSYGPSGSGNSLKTTLADQAGAVPDGGAGITAVAGDPASGNGTGTPAGASGQSNSPAPGSNTTPTASSTTGTTAPVAAAGRDGGGGGGCSVGSGNPFDPSLWLLAVGAAAAIVSRKRPINS